MADGVFEKTREDMRKNKDNNLVTTKKRKYYLVPEPNNHTTKFFTENLLAREMWKTQILMNKSVYVGLSVLDLRRTVIYVFWYVLFLHDMCDRSSGREPFCPQSLSVCDLQKAHHKQV